MLALSVTMPELDDLGPSFPGGPLHIKDGSVDSGPAGDTTNNTGQEVHTPSIQPCVEYG